MSIWEDTRPKQPIAQPNPYAPQMQYPQFTPPQMQMPGIQSIAAPRYPEQSELPPMQGMEPQFSPPPQAPMQMPGLSSLGTTPGASMAGPIAGGLVGAALLGKGLYDTYKGGKSDPASRLQSGFSTGGISELYRAGKKLFGGKSNKDQLQRDSTRKDLRASGFLDDNYNVSLSGGRKFDIGRDGSTKGYNVDFRKDGANEAVGSTQGLAAILAGQGGKAKDDLTGYLANAAMSSGKYSADDTRALYEKAGIDKQKAFAATNQMAASGQIDDATKAAYQNSFNTLFAAPPRSGKRK